jgi:hypothetical protein
MPVALALASRKGLEVALAGETSDQTDARLRAFLAAADFVVLDGEWSFIEAPLSEPPSLTGDVLAAVRNEGSWSSLVRAAPGSVDPWGIWSFHFSPDLDGSGFVGWLAMHLLREAGTRVIVVCGQNSAKGGIYDYWGVPADVLPEAVAIVEGLRDRAGEP